jgi:hypothetical protein
MTTLFSSFAGTLVALLVISGIVLAQLMRGNVTVAAGRLRMPSGAASDVS